MSSIFRDIWTANTPGPRTALRIFDALIAIIGIICIVVGYVRPAFGFIYYIILGVAALSSIIVSFLVYNERAVHPAPFIVLEFAIAGVNYAFGILSAIAASYTDYGQFDAIIAVFLIVVGFLHSVFFALACRDMHVRRKPTTTQPTKYIIEADDA